jgi:hypothetical protein
MIHVREEGWKELKVGTIFEVAVQPTVDERSNEQLERAHAVNNSYVAHLGGPDMLLGAGFFDRGLGIFG